MGSGEQGSSASDYGFALEVKSISKVFASKGKQSCVRALSSVSFSVPTGTVTAIVGPDGAGKTTLLRVIAGLLVPDDGALIFEGREGRLRVDEREGFLGYMPQRFGLYEDLSVRENMDLYADLRGVAHVGREERFKELLELCGMAPFRERLAGDLSGGMKQKLGLICTLVKPPKFLLLDEPTVGVDPLSRRELWRIIEGLTASSRMSVVVSTPSMDEASRCEQAVMLFNGEVLAKGAPDGLARRADGMCYQARPVRGDSVRLLQARLMKVDGVIDAVPQGGEVRFVHAVLDGSQDKACRSALCGAIPRRRDATLEDCLMVLLKGRANRRYTEGAVLPSCKGRLEHARDGEPVIEVKGVYRYFGDFAAVKDVSFDVYHGEVFGLLGPNGAGKTTTFRMLCGLLPASKGLLRVAGVDVMRSRTQARQRVGYVAQKFSLYGSLSVRENLRFFARAYGLYGQRCERRIADVVEDFSLHECLDRAAGVLPGGYRQRLAMAVGLLHEPSILFLDEPTSGADPLARREFWLRISSLADAGVTVVVTTHFMEEAEYCDRVLIQSDGVVLALGTPALIREEAGRAFAEERLLTMEDAFIAIVERAKHGGRRAV